MKLKLARLSNGQKEFIASVCYGADENGKGEKRFTETIKIGQVVDVTDEIGQALLGAYSRHFEIQSDVSPSVRKTAVDNDGHVVTSPQNADAEQIIDTEIKPATGKVKKSKDIQGAGASA